MLRKTTGVDVTIGVVDTICVELGDLQPPVIQTPLPQPKFPDPPVQPSGTTGVPVQTPPPPEDDFFRYLKIAYFDPIQAKVIVRYIPCAPSYYGDVGDVDLPPFQDIVILTPGGCG